MNKHKVKHHRKSDTKTANRDHIRTTALERSVMKYLRGIVKKFKVCVCKHISDRQNLMRFQARTIGCFNNFVENCMINFGQSYCPMFQKLRDKIKYSHTSPFFVPLQKFTYQLTANTQFTLVPIKVDIFVEKSNIEIQKQTCKFWIKDIKQPSIHVD